MDNSTAPALAANSSGSVTLNTATVRRFIGLIALFVAVLWVSGQLTGHASDAGGRAALSAFVLTALAAAYAYAPRNPGHAMGAVAIFMWLTTAANMWVFSGVYASGMVFFTLVISMTGWVLGKRWLIRMVAASALWIAWMAVAQVQGWHQPAPLPPPLHAAANWIGSLVAIGFFIAEGRRVLWGLGDQARRLASQLQQQLDTTQIQHDELHGLMESMPAAVAAFDANWRLLRCNRRYKEFFAPQAGDLTGKRFKDFAAPELAAQVGGIRDALQRGDTHVSRMHYRPAPDAPVRWLELQSVPQMRHGKLVQSVVTTVDITHTVQAEEQLAMRNRALHAQVTTQTQALDATQRELQLTQETLLNAEAKAAIATLVASVSHELNTPIGNSALVASALASSARALREDVVQGTLRRSTLEAQTASMLDAVALLERNLQRVQVLMGQFKQVSADQASEVRRRFDLAGVVKDTVDAMRPSLRTQPHAVVLHLQPGLVMNSYPGAVGQIVINLINNAYLHAFVPDTIGTVDVTTRGVEGSVVIEVRDNGAGMSDEVRERLFEPFFSTRIGSGGTGLGLSIVQHLAVKTLNGSIRVSSSPGMGTTFEVTLPLEADEPAPASAASSGSGSGSGSGQHEGKIGPSA
ncbi:MAG TPA: PAS domain-containing sensor histidine kinase [Burkholderiaceae bacterium]|nr:PAS domain-containing sensor histidine kinase [Burkholderiaceae bacterium]